MEQRFFNKAILMIIISSYCYNDDEKYNDLYIKLLMIRRPMSRNRNHNTPFPFSAYILKSYSTDQSKRTVP